MESYVQENKIPVVLFEKAQRKNDIAKQYLSGYKGVGGMSSPARHRKKRRCFVPPLPSYSRRIPDFFEASPIAPATVQFDGKVRPLHLVSQVPALAGSRKNIGSRLDQLLFPFGDLIRIAGCYLLNRSLSFNRF